jgi:hypothetical protein
MTVRDREVLEALREEPELLAIADAVAATGATRRRRRAVPLLAAAAAVAVLSLLLVEPWSDGGGPSLTGRALAAIGDGPILHAVVEARVPGQRVELSTGRTEPIVRSAEMWADEQQGVVLVVARAEGRVLSRRTVRLEPQLDAPFGLAAVYRQGLEEGKVHRIGEGVVRGRNVIWVASTALHGFALEAALDRETYDPLVMRYVRDGDVLYQMDVLKMDTVAAGSVRFGQPEDAAISSGRSSVTLPAAPPSSAEIDAARQVLSQPPLWLGRSYRTLPLSSLSVDVESIGSRNASARIVHLEYGNRRLIPQIGIDEINLRKERDYLQAQEEVVPPAGFVDLEGPSTATIGKENIPRWSGAFRRGRLYVKIEAGSRAEVLGAARSLRPAAAR